MASGRVASARVLADSISGRGSRQPSIDNLMKHFYTKRNDAAAIFTATTTPTWPWLCWKYRAIEWAQYSWNESRSWLKECHVRMKARSVGSVCYKYKSRRARLNACTRCTLRTWEWNILPETIQWHIAIPKLAHEAMIQDSLRYWFLSLNAMDPHQNLTKFTGKT